MNLTYSYRSVGGREIKDSQTYSCSKPEAIRRLREDFKGSVTPLMRIDGRKIRPDMTEYNKWRKQPAIG